MCSTTLLQSSFCDSMTAASQRLPTGAGFDGPSDSGRTVICRRGSIRFVEGADHIVVTDPKGPRELAIPDEDSWNDELTEFVAAIRDGRAMSVPAEEAARVVGIVDAARRAADAGVTVACR